VRPLSAQPTRHTGSPRSFARWRLGSAPRPRWCRGRPGSWEAADVLHLVRGTVGHDDEDLDGYRAGMP